MSDAEKQSAELDEYENSSPLNPQLLDDSADGVEVSNLKNGNTHFNFAKSLPSNALSDETKNFSTIEGELDFEDEVAEDETETKKSAEDLANCKIADDKDSDEGQCSPEKDQKKDDAEDGEDDGEDDGEISDDGDLEEGELRENSPVPKQPARQICRFYSKGQCTWGNVCRFLHLSGSEKSNYSMFASPPKYSNSGFGGGIVGSAPLPPVTHRLRGTDFLPAPPPIVVEPSPLESAWERGLRQAKELVKKANKRKEEEPDFEEKRLNLSLQVNEKNIPDHSKENDLKVFRRNRRFEDPYDYEEEEEEDLDLGYDNGDRNVKENWRRGRFENFEVHWNRDEGQKDQKDRDRSRGGGRVSRERDRYSRNNRNKDKWRDDRVLDVQTRTRAESWMDPWRRSKSPKGGNRLSRSRSGSYSTVSSYSYSDRGSSRSSVSYSRSSSRTSRSSRSRSQQKRKTSPQLETPVSQKKPEPNRPNATKNKPGARASSSRSRSMSRTPSASRSRSYSRSISMDSVSSASSSISRSSSRSLSPSRRTSTHKKQDKGTGHKSNPKNTVPLTSLYPDIQPLSIPKIIKKEPIDERDLDTLLQEQEKAQEELKANSFPNLQHLLPTNLDKVKEPVKGLHKQQIKLTLLNKAPPSKTASLQKKDDSNSKTKPADEPSKSAGGVKRPLSPTAPFAKPAVAPKKSASSRRDELLKQLKAVEDAIARKRAKI